MVLSVFRQLLLVTSLVVALPSMSVAQSGAAIQAMVERGQYADAVRQAEEQAELTLDYEDVEATSVFAQALEKAGLRG